MSDVRYGQKMLADRLVGAHKWCPAIKRTAFPRPVRRVLHPIRKGIWFHMPIVSDAKNFYLPGTSQKAPKVLGLNDGDRGPLAWCN